MMITRVQTHGVWFSQGDEVRNLSHVVDEEVSFSDEMCVAVLLIVVVVVLVAAVAVVVVAVAVAIAVVLVVGGGGVVSSW